MINLEERLVRRFSGGQFIIGSLVLGLCGWLPLQLVIWFGSPTANPLGLGLLALVTLPLAGIGLLIGLVKLAVRFFGDSAAD